MSLRFVLYSFAICVTLQSGLFAADDAAIEREKGIAALKDSQTRAGAIVDAARHFAKASELFMKAPDDAKAIEMNSFLFWCKKKMSYRDIEQFTQSGEKAVVEKLFMVEKIVPEADESQAWLDRAEKFAVENPTEHLLIAVRFFEVASRFVGSNISITAQERSLKELALNVENPSTLAAPTPIAKMPALEKEAPKEKTTIPDAVVSNVNDPILKRLNVAKRIYSAELENGQKAISDAFDKRESVARKQGDKKIVDLVKEERAGLDAKTPSERIQTFSPEQKHKIEAAWKTLSAEYENAIKELTKATRDAEANAIEKEYNGAKDDLAKASLAFKSDTAPAAAMAGETLKDKTYVVWLTMPTAKFAYFGLMSIETPLNQFDALGLGEGIPGKWMCGSEDKNKRNDSNQGANALESTLPGAPVQIACSFKDKDVAIYRNGKPYAKYKMTPESMKFGPESYVLFGVRSVLANDNFTGSIFEARLYSDALSPAQIAVLTPHTATGPKPWAWWTFEDGTCRDRMGHFLPGKAVNGVSIKGGALVFNGKGYFRCDPIGSVSKKK